MAEHGMCSILLACVLIEAACSGVVSVEEYVEQNLGAIATRENLIGEGCSADVYGFEFQNRSYVLKKFHDMKRCRKEIDILGRIGQFGLPVVPDVQIRDLTRAVIVMDRMDEGMGAYMDRNSSDSVAARRLVNEVLDGLTMLHERKIVHGDLHTDNIMFRGGRLFFVDFGDSFFSEDFALDLLRLRYRVLSKIGDWEALVERDSLRNPEAFAVIEKIYGDRSITLLFRLANVFNAPGMQYLVYRALRFATNLSSLISEYGSRIERPSSGS